MTHSVRPLTLSARTPEELLREVIRVVDERHVTYARAADKARAKVTRLTARAAALALAEVATDLAAADVRGQLGEHQQVYYRLSYRADCAGDWTIGDPCAVVYPTRAAAEAAWTAAYRGPDVHGNEAHPEYAEVVVRE